MDFQRYYRALRVLNLTPATITEIKERLNRAKDLIPMLELAVENQHAQKGMTTIRGKDCSTYTLTRDGEEWLDQQWTEYNRSIQPLVYTRWQYLNTFRNGPARANTQCGSRNYPYNLVRAGFLESHQAYTFSITPAGLQWLKAHDPLFYTGEAHTNPEAA